MYKHLVVAVDGSETSINALKHAAELAGVNVKRMLTTVYTLSGLICAFAGWALIGRIGSVSPTAGQFANIESITAVVIGGLSLFGSARTVAECGSLSMMLISPM